MPSLWPFIPLASSRETLEWLTDVMTTRSGEQRLKLRPDPRVSLGFTFHLDNAEFAIARGKIASNPAGDWLLPVWHDRSWVGSPVSAGASNIPCETNASYRVGGQVVLWESPTMYALGTIVSVNVGSLDLQSPIGTAFESPIAAPLRTVFPAGGFEISRVTIDATRIGVNFRVRDLATESASDLDVYLGSDVQTDPSLATAPLEESITKPVAYIDNKFGPVVSEPRRDITEMMFSISCLDSGAAAYWRRRQWVSGLSGKVGVFWLPSYADDLQITAPILSAGTTLKVVPIMDSTADYLGLHIMIIDQIGRIYREITAAVVNGDDHDLTLAPLGRDISSARICFMRLCRFDTDAIVFEHSAPEIHRMRAVCREVSA